LQPEIFIPYLEGEELPGFSSGSYTLVPEIVWKRFYGQNRDMYFLKSELNPYLPRPSSGFAIVEEAAVVLSPRTFFTVPETEQ
jgi:hypothetical protein